MPRTIEEILDDLNPQQREAVTYQGKYLLVSAGAGSGKTRVLTRRIAYELLMGEAEARNFMAITFTNKAANEMKERLKSLVGPSAGYMQISTFHSACARLLRMYPASVGLDKNFAIYDDDAKSKALSQIVSKMGFTSEVNKECKSQKKWISKCKNRGISWESVFEDLGLNRGAEYIQKMPWNTRSAIIYRDYERELAKDNAVDFDDLISKAAELLEKDKEVRERLQGRFTRIFVDEYQDTNPAQYKLIRLLASPQAYVTVVGDSDQSIYAFRGSDVSIIRNFTNDFKGSKTVLLEQNYRSTPDILAVANSVIKHNPKRIDKKLWTKNEKGKAVELVECESEMQEADFVASTIEDLHSSGTSYSDFAVLYRNNDLSEPVEKKLVARGIFYQIRGGKKFYDRKEVKDAIAYLTSVINPKDDVSLLRIINTPARGIGKTSQEKLTEYAMQKGIHLQEALKDPEGVIKPAVGRACKELAAKLGRWRSLSSSISLSGFVKEVVEESGLLDEKNENREERNKNLYQLCSAAEEMEIQDPQASIVDFLEHVSLMQAGGEAGSEKEAVSLMTIHSAKGLEFPIVFVIGMEEGIFPPSNATSKDEEEERRLAYVAITRAKKILFLTYADERFLFGKRENRIRSRFLDEIPPKLLEEKEGGFSSYSGFGRRYKKRNSPSYDSLFSENSPFLRERELKARKEPGGEEKGQLIPGAYVIHKTMGLGTVQKVFFTPTGMNVKINFKGYGAICFPASDKSLEILD
ncbi:MAG: UvrD-helicase domain-containing protein [Aeriscardovia sp.]|nr:UvrD-helicase domain-containing protein [Aeriscardovia sp.]